MPCNYNSVPCSAHRKCNGTKGLYIGSHPLHVSCAKIIASKFSRYYQLLHLLEISALFFQARLFGHTWVVFFKCIYFCSWLLLYHFTGTVWIISFPLSLICFLLGVQGRRKQKCFRVHRDENSIRLSSEH